MSTLLCPCRVGKNHPLRKRKTRKISHAILTEKSFSHIRKMRARAHSYDKKLMRNSSYFMILFYTKLIFGKVLKRLCFYVCNPYNGKIKRVIFV